MKVYIVFDTRTGDILHKYRSVSGDISDSEDTQECKPEEVLASYRGERAPKEYLAVALLSKYQPRSSRLRKTTYDPKKAQIVDQIKQELPVEPRSYVLKAGGRPGKE